MGTCSIVGVLGDVGDDGAADVGVLVPSDRAGVDVVPVAKDEVVEEGERMAGSSSSSSGVCAELAEVGTRGISGAGVSTGDNSASRDEVVGAVVVCAFAFVSNAAGAGASAGVTGLKAVSPAARRASSAEEACVCVCGVGEGVCVCVSTLRISGSGLAGVGASTGLSGISPAPAASSASSDSCACDAGAGASTGLAPPANSASKAACACDGLLSRSSLSLSSASVSSSSPIVFPCASNPSSAPSSSSSGADSSTSGVDLTGDASAGAGARSTGETTPSSSVASSASKDDVGGFPSITISGAFTSTFPSVPPTPSACVCVMSLAIPSVVRECVRKV
ncbi:hypothetical protein C8F04DRAFT_1107255, partial [Mycena alexandri]